METSLSYTDKTAWISSDERKWISRIRKLQEEHPDDVVILAEPENNDGCIYAKLPASWFKLNPPRQYSDEALQKLRDSMARLRDMS